MAESLPRSTPSAQGIDAAGLVAFIAGLEATPGVEPHSLMMIRHGTVVAEGWWRPYAATRVHLLYSLSKSFTSTAVGFAVAEGLIDLDSTVLSYFPELDAEITDARSRSMLVRHIAAMASGHRDDTIDRAEAVDPVDLVRGFLLIPPDEVPGSVFAYNQPCTFALAAIVQRVSGQSLTDYLRPRLFQPLGIGVTGWLCDASGREIGYSGMHANTEAVVALGQLYLQEGSWGGVQLLPASWVREATRPHIETLTHPEPDWHQGYGFQFWMARHGYRGDGAFGQFCVVLPEYSAVVAMTGQTSDMQAVLDLLWRHLLPAMAAGSAGSVGADTVLAQRLSALALPATGGSAVPGSPVPLRFTAAAGNDQPGLTEVQLAADTQGTWTLALLEAGSRLEVAVGIGEWRTTDVIAASGGWVGDDGGALVVDLVFLETPHRLRLRCNSGSATFDCDWVTGPLHPGPLAGLRMPR